MQAVEAGLRERTELNDIAGETMPFSAYIKDCEWERACFVLMYMLGLQCSCCRTANL